MLMFVNKNHDRRRQGRPRNVNRKPSDAHIATTREVVDEIDRLVPGYSKMSLGMKLEHILSHYKQLIGKNPIGQVTQTNLSGQQQQLITLNVNNESNESTGWSEEELYLHIRNIKPDPTGALLSDEPDVDETKENEDYAHDNDVIYEDDEKIPTEGEDD